MTRISKTSFLLLYLLASAVITVLVLLRFFPWHPVTLPGWLLLYFLVTPLFLAGKYIHDSIRDKISYKIDPSKKSVSGRRILFLLIFVPLYVCLLICLDLILQQYFGGFIHQHFSKQW